MQKILIKIKNVYEKIKTNLIVNVKTNISKTKSIDVISETKNNNTYNDLTNQIQDIKRFADQFNITESIVTNEKLFETNSIEQIKTGKKLINFLTTISKTNNLLTNKIENLIFNYSVSTGKLSTHITEYISNFDETQDLAEAGNHQFNLYCLFQKYLAENKVLNNEIQKILTTSFHSENKDHKNYLLTSLFTHNDQLMVEFNVHNTLEQETLLEQELTEKLKQACIIVINKFSLALQKDDVLIELFLINGLKELKIVGPIRIDTEFPQSLQSKITHLIISKLKYYKRQNNFSYLSIINSDTYLIKYKVLGPHHAENFLNKEDIINLLEKKICINLNYELLDHLYEKTSLETLNYFYCTEINSYKEVINIVQRKKMYTNKWNPLTLILSPGAHFVFKEKGNLHFAENQLKNKTFKRKELPIAIQYGINNTQYEIHTLKILMNYLQASIKKTSKNTSLIRNTKFNNHKLQKRVFSTKKDLIYSPSLDTIKPLKTKSKSKNVRPMATIDFETIIYNNKVVPYLLGIYYDQKYVSFATSQLKNHFEDVCINGADYILTNLKGYNIFAHNWAKFDGILLIAALNQVMREKYNGTTNSIQLLHNTNSVLICVRIPEFSIKFLDSYLFIPLSLEKAAQSFLDTTKRKNSIKINQITETNLTNTNILQELIIYNKTDCILLFNILETFENIINNKFNISPFQKNLTLPALAFRIFRQIFATNQNPNEKIFIPKHTFDAKIRAAYRGGRCEIFNHIGETTTTWELQFIDFISLYAASAYGFPQPVGSFSYVSKEKCGHNLSKLGFYYCKIEAKNNEKLHNNIPFLPTKYEKDTMYPTGVWFGYYTSVEINYAKSLKYYNIEILEGIIFREKTYLFDQYVKTIFNWKDNAEKSNNLGQRKTAKLLLNSLFGKFGQKNKKTTTKILQVENAESKFSDNDLSKITSRRKLDNNYEIMTILDHNKLPQTAPQIAAFITAHARIILHKTLMILTQKNAKILYVDTDSIAFMINKKPKFDLNEINKQIELLYNKKLKNTNLGHVVPIYKETKILRIDFVTIKFYRIILASGEIIIKSAGYQLTETTKYNIKLWQNLINLNKTQTTTYYQIPINSRIIKNNNVFELDYIPEQNKKIIKDIESQTKRKIIRNLNGEYVKTVPPLINDTIYNWKKLGNSPMKK